MVVGGFRQWSVPVLARVARGVARGGQGWPGEGGQGSWPTEVSALHCTALPRHCTALYTVLCNTLLYCNVLYCTLLTTTTQPFQKKIPITDIATYRLNQPRGQCSENHLKCITRWEGRDGVTVTIFFHHTRDGHKTSYL